MAIVSEPTETNTSAVTGEGTEREPLTIDPPPSSAAKRGGYVVGATVNAIMLWVAHQLLDWEFPGFLTSEFVDVLPWITASCLISIAGYALMFVRVERLLPKLLNDAATAGASFLATLSMLRVFPFDFESYDVDWSWLIRLVLILALVGSAIAFSVAVVKLLFWPLRKPASGT